MPIVHSHASAGGHYTNSVLYFHPAQGIL